MIYKAQYDAILIATRIAIVDTIGVETSAVTMATTRDVTWAATQVATWNETRDATQDVIWEFIDE